MAHSPMTCDEDWRVFSEWTNRLLCCLVGIDSDFEIKFREIQKSERLKFCLNCEIVEQVCSDYYDLIRCKWTTCDKSEERAETLRLRGNDLFRNKQFKEATAMYSEAICQASFPSFESPSEDSVKTQLSLGFANRSAALFHLNFFQSSLNDIDYAIKYGYPSESQHKLLIRKALCMKAMKQYDESKQLLNELLLQIQSSELKDKALIEDEITKHIRNFDLATFGNRIDVNVENQNGLDDNVTEAEIKHLPHGCDEVQMLLDPVKGRIIKSTKRIAFGDTIFVERPFVFLLHANLYDEMCSNCMHKLESYCFPCKHCSQVRFCSSKCQQEAFETFHKCECLSFLNLYQEIGIAYIVLRIIFKQGIENIFDAYSQCNDGDMLLCKAYASNYKSLLSLMDHEEDHPDDEILRYHLGCCFLLTVLRQGHYIERNKENYYTVGKVILRHLMQISTNGIAILHQQFDSNITSFGLNTKENAIGIGLYPTISLLSHSCEPNVMTLFRDSTLTIKASKSIYVGEEVCYCYGPSVQSMTRKDRQSFLRSQYYFECTCTPCLSKKESTKRALNCIKCKGPVIYNSDGTNQCLECGIENLNLSESLLKISDGEKQLEEGIDLMEEEEYGKAIHLLEQCNELFTKTLYRYNHLLSKATDNICRCHAMRGSFDVAANFCRKNMDIISGIFGKESVEFGYELIKLISLKYHIIDEMDRSSELFSSSLGDINADIDNGLNMFKKFAQLASSELKTIQLQDCYSNEIEMLNEKKEAVLCLSQEVNSN